MSTQNHSIDKEKTYSDSNYDTDVEIQFVDDLVVLVKDLSTGHKRLCGREDFGDNKRFKPNE